MLSDKIEYVDDVCRACGIIVTHVVKGLWMPSLSFFIDERDICLLLDHLNEDLAFLGPADPSCWRRESQYLACLCSVSHVFGATPLGCD